MESKLLLKHFLSYASTPDERKYPADIHMYTHFQKHEVLKCFGPAKEHEK